MTQKMGEKIIQPQIKVIHKKIRDHVNSPMSCKTQDIGLLISY